MDASSPLQDLTSIPSQLKDRLLLFNRLVQRGFEDAEEENKQFGDYQKYVMDNALTDNDIKALRLDNRSTLNYPILKPYVQRSIKNIIDSSPTTSVTPCNEDDKDQSTGLPTKTISEILNHKMKDIYEDNNWKHVIFKVAQDAFIGGKGIFKVRTDYKNESDFEQKIIIEGVEDPTTVIFDSRARSLTRSDGEFSAELCPMTKEDFESYYPDIPWSEIQSQGKWIDSLSSRNTLNWYRSDQRQRIVVICDMHYKQYEKKTIYMLNNGEIVDKKLTKEQKEMGIEVIQSRKIRHTDIYHTRFCGEIELEKPTITNFSNLPLIRLPGEILYKKGKEMLLPYAQHAFDAQRTKNFLMNFFLNEALNHQRGLWLYAKESLDDQDLMNLRRPMDMFALGYNQYGQNESNGEMVTHAPPAYIQPPPVPTELLEGFTGMDTTIEKILGNQFPSMNEVDLSGKALYNMADYMSASNEVFIQHLMSALTSLGQLILDTIPKILKPELIGLMAPNQDPNNQNISPQSTLMYDFSFKRGHYKVYITRGVNYKLQQQRNVEMLLEFGKMYPPLLQFLFTDGFKFMIGNMDFNNKEEILEGYERYEQKMQSQQQNPEAQQMQKMMMEEKQAEIKNQAMNSQARLMKAQTDQQKLSLETKKLHHSQHEVKSDDILEMYKLGVDLTKNRLDNLTKLHHIKSLETERSERIHHGSHHT